MTPGTSLLHYGVHVAEASVRYTLKNWTALTRSCHSSIPIISLSLNAEAFPVFSSLPRGELSDSTSLVFQ